MMENDSELQETLYTDRYVELPELDETQIWDGEDIQRDVVLYLSTKDGKVNGPENPPFQLPYRWTLETLRKCIMSYVSSRTDIPEELINLKQIYYKKSGRSRSVVALKTESDITALLKEYPLTYANGKKKTGWGKTVLYLAIDWTNISDEDIRGSPSIRRSPRTNSKDVIDIFLFTAEKKNSDFKISGSASVIPKIKINSSLDDIKKKIREVENERVIYVPVKGLFWLRKGKKQCVNLNSEEDLETCKNEYRDGKGNVTSIRLACATVPLGATPLSNTNKRKRKLWYSEGGEVSSLSGESGDNRDLNLIEASKILEVESSKKVSSDSNELWNDVHCTLLRELERLGTLQRYGHKHLKLWTDLIVEGKNGGVGEEPPWEKYIEIIGVPPKTKYVKTVDEKTEKTDKMENDQLLKNILIQNSCMMAMMSANMSYMQQPQGRPTFYQPMQPGFSFSNSSGSPPCVQNPSFIPNSSGVSCQEMNGKKLKDFNLNDCCDFLCSLKLDTYVINFRESQMDGLLLSSVVHPHFGNMLLNGMGITDEEDVNKLIEAVKGYM